jgi:hypothetical protein
MSKGGFPGPAWTSSASLLTSPPQMPDLQKQIRHRDNP